MRHGARGAAAALAVAALLVAGRARGEQPEPDAGGGDSTAPADTAPGGTTAPADTAPGGTAAPAPAETAPGKTPGGEQALIGALGVALGGRSTPGGFAVDGHYLYRLSDVDWFDARVGFSFGGGGAACFRDRQDHFVCDHGVADGFGAAVTVGVRRYFPGQGRFAPFARAGVGVRLDNFGSDSVRGLAVPIELGGGIRAQVADQVSVVGEAALNLGLAWFNHDLGTEPQLGLAVTFGAEFAL